jgi:hypothetical protein
LFFIFLLCFFIFLFLNIPKVCIKYFLFCTKVLFN